MCALMYVCMYVRLCMRCLHVHDVCFPIYSIHVNTIIIQKEYFKHITHPSTHNKYMESI